MPGPRSQARRYALLALYQWQLTGEDPAQIVRQFVEDPAWVAELAGGLAGVEEDALSPGPAYDRELFRDLVHGIPARLEEIDGKLQPVLDRPILQVDPVERAILRLGTFEILSSPAMPCRVVINEAVDLAKLLGAEQGHRYVNGVLDRLARAVRPAEMTGGPAATR